MGTHDYLAHKLHEAHLARLYAEAAAHRLAPATAGRPRSLRMLLWWRRPGVGRRSVTLRPQPDQA